MAIFKMSLAVNVGNNFSIVMKHSAFKSNLFSRSRNCWVHLTKAVAFSYP